MKISTFIEKTFIIDTIKNKKISFVYNKILGTIMIIFFFLILLLNLFGLTQIKKFFEANILTFIILGSTSICLESSILALYIVKTKLMNTKSMKFQDLITIMVDIQSILIYSFNMLRFWIIFPLKLLLLSVYIASPNIRSQLFGSNIPKFLFNIFIFMETLLSILITLNLFAIEKPIDPNKSTFFTKLSFIFEETLYVCVFVCCGVNAFEAAETLEKTESLHLILFFLKFIAFLVMNITYFSELPYFDKYTENLVGVVLPFTTFMFFILGFLKGNASYISMIILFIGPFIAVASLFYIKSSYQKTVVYLMENKINIAVKKIFLKNKSEEIRRLVDIDIREYRFSKERRKWSKNIRRMKGYEDEKEFGIEKEMDMVLLKKFIEKKKNILYGKYLIIIWMLEYDNSTSRLLRTLNEMMSKSNNTLYAKYLYQSAKYKVQAEFRKIYKKPKKDLSGDEIKNRKMKFLKLEEELEEFNAIDVDLAYAFRYKKEVTNLTKLINTYVEINKEFISKLKAQSKSLKDLHALSSKLYVIHKNIVKCFHFLHKFSREGEVIHLGPFFIYLIKCANLHRRAEEIIKIYKKRLIKSKNLVDNSSIFADNNLFKDTIILKTESSEKGFGTILDIYGNLKLLKCNGLTEQSFIGKHFNCFIPESHQKPHYVTCRASLESAKSSSLGKNKFVFITIPNSDKILPANLKVKIIPSAKYNFKFVIGVKFLREDSNMYMILGKENQVEAYSYNMKHQFEGNDKFLVTGVNISELSQKIKDKLKKFDMNEDVGESEDSKDIDDQEYIVENSVDIRSNFASKDYVSLMNKRKEFRAELIFKDKLGLEKVKKKFLIEIIKKTYSDTEYSYHILVLRNDNNTKRHKDIKSKTDTKYDGNSSKFSSQMVINRVDESNFESEDEHQNLLEKKNKNSLEFKAGHELEEEKEDIVESQLEINNQEEFEESDSEEEDSSIQNFNFEKANIGTGSVFSTVGGIQSHKKFVAFEDTLSKKPGLFKIILMLLCYFFCLGVTTYSNYSLGVGLESVSQQFKLFNELSTVVYEHQFEIQMFYTKLLSGVVYESGITHKDRYSKFDLEIEKAPMIPEITRSEDIETTIAGIIRNKNYVETQISSTTESRGNTARKVKVEEGKGSMRMIQEETSSSTNRINLT